jgi:flavin-dependent dehydrogenase
MSTADAVIVGAGPAGSIAALVLARAGVRVRLIDRASFPRFKLCGDTLNPGALSILRELDEATALRVTAHALPIDGMIVTGPAGARVAADYQAGVRGVAIARADLDLMLLEAAIAAGASFEEGVSVLGPVVVAPAAGVPGASDAGDRGRAEAGQFEPRGSSDVGRDDDIDAASVMLSGRNVRSARSTGTVRVCGVRAAAGHTHRTLTARVVIAADGRASRLGGALQLCRFAARPRRWAFGAHYLGVTGLSSRGEMHIRGDGYLGIAPLPGGAANVCVVRELPRQRAPRSAPADAAAAAAGRSDGSQILAAAIAADPVLTERFKRAHRSTPVTTLGPLAVEAGAAGVPGMLLAGDAAGFVDPMTGDGLRFAIRGGVLAAEAAFEELSTGQPAFRALAAARQREFASKWRVNRALRALVGSPRGVAFAAALATQWDAPVRYLVGVAGDVALARRGLNARYLEA